MRKLWQMYAMLLFLLFVVNQQKGRSKSKGLLESAKGKLLGVVLNDREREEGLYYYYGAN